MRGPLLDTTAHPPKTRPVRPKLWHLIACPSTPKHTRVQLRTFLELGWFVVNYAILIARLSAPTCAAAHLPGAGPIHLRPGPAARSSAGAGGGAGPLSSASTPTGGSSSLHVASSSKSGSGAGAAGGARSESLAPTGLDVTILQPGQAPAISSRPRCRLMAYTCSHMLTVAAAARGWQR